MPRGLSSRRLTSTIAAAALLVAGLAAIAVAPAASASSLPVGTGPVHGGTFLTFNLTDRLQAQVNVGSGNLLVRSTDLVLTGIEGNVTLGAAYNSRMIGSSTETGAFGHGWGSRSGIDVRLIANSDGTVTFTAADGVVGVFKPITGTSPTQYTSPGVFKATLVKTSSGWNLTDHGTGQVTAFNSSGHPATITDRNGNVTTVSYNSSGQQTKITSDWGPAAIRVGATAYGSNGFISSYTQTGTDATTHTVSYGYDSAGNLTSITDPDGNQYVFGYDSAHDLTSITTPTTTGGVNEQTTITYDSSHRVTSLTRLIGPKSTDLATTRLSYVSSTETQVADPNTDQTQPVANVPHTTYTLDSQLRVTKVTDPAGNNQSISYTPFNDVATYTDAVGGQTTNTYPSSVNGGESLTNSKSPMGASVSLAYANPATTSNPTANFQPSSSTDAQTNATAYGYNGPGNLASAKDALAAVASVGYSQNLLSTMTASNGPLYTFGYDADGRRTATFFNTVPGNATWAARTLTSYDKSGRITRITTALNSDPASLVFDTSYCYSPFVSGQSCPTGSSSTDTELLRYSTDNLTGKVSVYSYDKGNRLTQATNISGHTYGYGYDADGNRTSVTTDGATTQSLSYNSANQISSSGYSYDGAGNMTAAPGGTSYSYNAAEQMTSSTVNGTTSAHAYAGAGQQELTSAGSNQFVWGRPDQYGQPWLESFNTGGASQVFVERDGLGTPLGLHTGGSDSYLVPDNLGSVVAVVNTAGTVAARYSYDPYGNAVSVDESGLSQPNIVRYTGGAFDQATGLSKLGQRYYNPALGAFTQQDADQILANPQNGNLYAYAGDDPTNNTDPSGQLVPGSNGCPLGCPYAYNYSQDWQVFHVFEPWTWSPAAKTGVANGVERALGIPPGTTFTFSFNGSAGCITSILGVSFSATGAVLAWPLEVSQWIILGGSSAGSLYGLRSC